MATRSLDTKIRTPYRETRHLRPVGDMSVFGPNVFGPVPTTFYDEEQGGTPAYLKLSEPDWFHPAELVHHALIEPAGAVMPGSETGLLNLLPVRDRTLYRFNVVGFVPPTLYDEGSLGSSVSIKVGSPYWLHPRGLVDDVWLDSQGALITGSDTGAFDVLPVSDELSNALFPLSSNEYPVTKVRVVFGGSIGAGVTFFGPEEVTIDLMTEGGSYDPPGQRTAKEGFSLNQALVTLHSTNPDAAARIRKLVRLEPDWDGFGGRPPTEEAMKAAADLLIETHKLAQDMIGKPFISPLPEGGLDIEWELDSGVELMIVIPSNGKGKRYVLDEPVSSGETKESEGTIPRGATLSKLINRLIQ